MNLKLNTNWKKQKNLKSFVLSMEKKGVSSEKILLNLIPNVPKNLSIEFFLTKKYIRIAPFEEMKIYKDLAMKKNNNQNSYSEVIEAEYKVDNEFKPGYKLMYFDFINEVIFSKKSKFSINLREMIKIQKILNRLK